MPIDRDGKFFEGGRAIAVEGGIAVRAKRGQIGEQWWSRRFVDVLERVCDGGRLARGRAYARKGQVMDFHLSAGKVTARVQGSRPQPYEVEIGIAAFDAAQWTDVTASLGGRALYRAALLAGDMPREILEVFDEHGLPLFPDRLDIRCSCPDWSVPCKHGSAALYVLAEAFDDAPLPGPGWRRRSRRTRPWCGPGGGATGRRCSPRCAAPPSRSSSTRSRSTSRRSRT